MLARSRNMLYEHIRDFTLVEKQGRIIAAGALHIIWEDLAEIRALAVNPRYLKQGLGSGLVTKLLEDAIQLGCRQVFSLTYQPGFFEKCGFTQVTKDFMPPKVWKECINCPKFPNCDETAMIFDLPVEEFSQNFY